MIKFILIPIFILVTNSCKKDNSDNVVWKLLDKIPTNKYYATDVMPDIYKNVYGNWKISSVSGGFGGNEITADFDFLVLKANGIFGIIRNDSLIAYGKVIVNENKGSASFTFDFDKSANIQLMHDSEKYIQLLGNDTMILNAPCCDRYNFNLLRFK